MNADNKTGYRLGWSFTLALFLSLIVIVSATAQLPSPLQTNTDSANSGHEWFISPLDTQGCWPDSDSSCWVINSARSVYGDRCGWNDQDSILRAGGGYVEGTFTDQLCLIADFDNCCFAVNGNPTGIYPKGIYVNVYSPSDTLVVNLSNNVGDFWQAGAPVKRGNQKLYRICVHDPVAEGSGVQQQNDLSLFWPAVPDSNGGYGQRVDYTLTIASPNRRTRDVWSQFEIATANRTPDTNGERHTIKDCPT